MQTHEIPLCLIDKSLQLTRSTCIRKADVRNRPDNFILFYTEVQRNNVSHKIVMAT